MRKLLATRFSLHSCTDGAHDGEAMLFQLGANIVPHTFPAETMAARVNASDRVFGKFFKTNSAFEPTLRATC